MKLLKFIAVAVAFTAAGAAFAQGTAVSKDASPVSTKTRAQVMAEIDPLFVHGEQNAADRVATKPTKGTRTSAEVYVEAAEFTKSNQKAGADTSFTSGIQ